MACMLISAQGVGRVVETIFTQAELVPSPHTSVSYRGSSLLTSGRSPCNHFTSCRQQSPQKNPLFFLSLTFDASQQEVGVVVLEIRNGECPHIYIHDCTCTAAIIHREQYVADSIFIETYCCECVMGFLFNT